MPFTTFFLFSGKLLLLLLRVPLTSLRGRRGTDERTSGGCFVAVHEMHGIEVSLANESVCSPESSLKSNSVRSSRSSSEMRELPWPTLLIRHEEPKVRKVRLGHDGYAQLADGLQSSNRGVTGESEMAEEVSDGGETDDFGEMLMGLAKADSEMSDEVDEDGESDASLLLSESIVFRGRVAKRV